MVVSMCACRLLIQVQVQRNTEGGLMCFHSKQSLIEYKLETIRPQVFYVLLFLFYNIALTYQ